MSGELPHSCSHCQSFHCDFSKIDDHDTFPFLLHRYKDWNDLLKEAKGCRLLATVLDSELAYDPSIPSAADGQEDVTNGFCLKGEFKKDDYERVKGIDNFWGIELDISREFKSLRKWQPICSMSFHISTKKGGFSFKMKFLLYGNRHRRLPMGQPF
jgi:hypothetical protein